MESPFYLCGLMNPLKYRSSSFNPIKRFYNLRVRNKVTNTATTSIFTRPRDIDDLVRYLNDLLPDLLVRREDGLHRELSRLLRCLDHEGGNCGGKVLTRESVVALEALALKSPNRVHPDVKRYENDFEIVRVHGDKKTYPSPPLTGTQLLSSKDLLKISGLNHYCGERSYYFVHDVAKMEQGLIDFTLWKLLEKNFNLISVPDILIDCVIEKCGMPTADTRTQVNFDS